MEIDRFPIMGSTIPTFENSVNEKAQINKQNDLFQCVARRSSDEVLSFDKRSLDFVLSLLDRPCTHDAPACWDSWLAATCSDTQRDRLLLIILPIYQMLDAVCRHSHESGREKAREPNTKRHNQEMEHKKKRQKQNARDRQRRRSRETQNGDGLGNKEKA
jgi:hypothetical protein